MSGVDDFPRYFSLRPVAGIVAGARLHRPAYIGETLLLESFIDNFPGKKSILILFPAFTLVRYTVKIFSHFCAFA